MPLMAFFIAVRIVGMYWL